MAIGDVQRACSRVSITESVLMLGAASMTTGVMTHQAMIHDSSQPPSVAFGARKVAIPAAIAHVSPD